MIRRVNWQPPSDDEIKEFIAYFGEENLPDPTHYPKEFLFKWKMWKFLTDNNK